MRVSPICLTLPLAGVAFGAMPTRMLLLVLHYDGTNFSGWQRQPDRRTVQGELETALSRLCAGPVAALGSGRTDAGVHARGQAVGVRVPEKWAAPAMRRAAPLVFASTSEPAMPSTSFVGIDATAIGNVPRFSRKPSAPPLTPMSIRRSAFSAWARAFLRVF